jgi:copper chaperone CopZ
MRMQWIQTALASAALATLTIGVVGCATTQQTDEGRTAMADDQPITTDTATLTVHGMGCPLCANNVDKQLKDVTGVTDVRVDMGSGRVTVHLAAENRPSKAQLARAIRQSGFTLVRIDTP